MKILLHSVLAIVILFLTPTINFAQTPALGTAADYILFSANGSVSISGNSQITGNVGTNNGSSTFSVNVNGVIENGNAASTKCAADILIAYDNLNNLVPDSSLNSSLGNGQILPAGIYALDSATTLNQNLTLDAKGNANALFIFQIQGALSANANSKIKLINGALACNVFWKVEGMVSLDTGTSMKGTIIAHNAAINLTSGDTLEGRALSTGGAVTASKITAYTPIGCGSKILSGPIAPELGAAACYAIFSSTGVVSDSNLTYVTGDIGSNVDSVIGYNSSNVQGTIHPVPDNSTAKCAADLQIAYNYLDTLSYDIELFYPTQFGNNLVLTPHTYRMNGAAIFTDSLYLNAQGNANAVFVIQINGSLTTDTYSKVILTNGAQAKNVFWKVNGGVSINDFSVFNGTIMCNNGAIALINGAILKGRAFTKKGAIKTVGITATLPTGSCSTTNIVSLENINGAIKIYPNPFSDFAIIKVNNKLKNYQAELKIYNVFGNEVLNTIITKQTAIINTSILSSGIYFYKMIKGKKIIQSGKLIAQ